MNTTKEAPSTDTDVEITKILGLELPAQLLRTLKSSAVSSSRPLRHVITRRLSDFNEKLADVPAAEYNGVVTRLTADVKKEPVRKTSVYLPANLLTQLRQKAVDGDITLKILVLAALVDNK